MKCLKYLLLVIPFLFIGSVKAESLELDYSLTYNEFDNSSSFQQFLIDNDNIITSLYQNMFDKYNSDYSSIYPYYLIQFRYVDSKVAITLIATDSPLFLKKNGDTHGETYFEDGNLYDMYSSRTVALYSYYSFIDTTYYLPYIIEYINHPAHLGLVENTLNETFFLDSNYDLKIYTDYDNIIVHNFRGTNSDYIINSGDIYPTLYKSGVFTNKQLAEVNLNDYAYIALALKDYSLEPFTTEVYAKGNYCITPVYNYGMTERNEILDGTKIERCSPYYENYTPIRTYILDSDLKNHAIYYLKAYDTTKDNYVKIDTSVFDITYITEENKDNPYVMINGKSYPTIPYDELTDSATISEDEGYVSGSSEDFSFSDIFTAPLEFLKDVWNSIVNVFDLIIEFIYLLPKELQGFLISSFYLAVAVGLLKMLL